MQPPKTQKAAGSVLSHVAYFPIKTFNGYVRIFFKFFF